MSPDRVLSATVLFEPLGALQDAERTAAREARRNVAAEALERLRTRPDVVAASRASGTPLHGTMSLPLRVPGYDTLPALPGGGPYATAVDADYFTTVGTRIVRGVPIDASHVSRGEHVVVVNEPMARALWGGDEPLGRCLHIGRGDDAPCHRVIGVAQETRRRQLVEEPAMQYYVPLLTSAGSILVRPAGPAPAFEAELRSLFHATYPGISYVSIRSLADTLDPQVRPWRLGATLFLLFGGLALLIAAVGLYSVIAYGVTRRRGELGVRRALGAPSGTIARMILGQAATLVLAGVGLGVPVAVVAGGRLEPVLFRTSTSDLRVFGAVATALLLTAVVAALLPAARAGMTQPSEALRAE